MDRRAVEVGAGSASQRFEGEVEDGEKDKMGRFGEDAVMRKRIRYKKFQR